MYFVVLQKKIWVGKSPGKGPSFAHNIEMVHK